MQIINTKEKRKNILWVLVHLGLIWLVVELNLRNKTRMKTLTSGPKKAIANAMHPKMMGQRVLLQRRGRPYARAHPL